MNEFSLRRLLALKNIGFYPKKILDIGAHDGTWSQMAFGIWPNAKFYLIEADKSHYNKLKNLSFIKSIKIALIGRKIRKKVKFYKTLKSINTGNSIYLENTSYFNEFEIDLLPMATLDNISKDLGTASFDIVKIDCQGSELDIVKGGLKTIKNAQFIILETQNLEYIKNSPSSSKVISYMDKIGFMIFDIVQIHYLPSGEMMHVDFLFAPKNSKYIRRGKLF